MFVIRTFDFGTNVLDGGREVGSGSVDSGLIEGSFSLAVPHFQMRPNDLMENSRHYRIIPNSRYALPLPDWGTPLENLRLKIFQATVTGYIRLETEIPSER